MISGFKVVLDYAAPAAATLFRVSLLDDEPIIFPTDTIYGLGAHIGSYVANKKIFTLKKRDPTNPLPVLAGSWEQVKDVALISKDEEAYLKRIWPGAYTVILKAKSNFINNYSYLTKNGTVAIRLAGDKTLRDALLKAGTLMTATSVNISGSKPLTDKFDILNQFKGCKYLLLGESGKNPSQILDFTQNRKRIR